MTNTILNKFSELLPPSMQKEFIDMKDEGRGDSGQTESSAWLDSPFIVLRKHLQTISMRNVELEGFMKQTIQCLSETESRIIGELTSRKDKFSKDRDIDSRISSDMSRIRKDLNIFTDFEGIKNTVLHKIVNINKVLEEKSKDDMLRLKQTEKNLQDMGQRMSEIKNDAEELRRRSQDLEFEITRDALTGLYNRRAYDDKIGEILAHVKRYGIKASLIICDIDFFKKINDAFGHKVGDLALRKLASLLRERLRTNDFVARYGGEEFAIVLPHTDLHGALKACDGVRSLVDKSVFTYNGNRIPLKISAGISAFRDDDDADTVFNRADRALYLAKESGRNRISTEDDLTVGEEEHSITS